MAERPAMRSAGPRRPRPTISLPSEAVAFFPCVYRLGEQNTEIMASPCWCWLFQSFNDRDSIPLLRRGETGQDQEMPRLGPTTTSGWCLSNSAWAILTASLKSSSRSFGLMTSWPWPFRYVGFTAPGTDCQPCRTRVFILARSSRRLLPCQGNQHRVRQLLHADVSEHVHDLR